ncbi:hypothetical protein QYF61_024075 [Mycteria americana]|uniref:Uncharacterized protein n=1 Tax=Mycteria americana TaxID=33587 RepID=A0AAN7PBK4_MYCAM|nr:hypothetical protein QYF61_024075 [Mycteria americana]
MVLGNQLWVVLLEMGFGPDDLRRPLQASTTLPVVSSHSSFTRKHNPLTTAHLLKAWRLCAKQEAQGTPCSLTVAELHPPSEALIVKGQLFSGSLCGSSRYPQFPQRVPMSPPTIPDKVPKNSRRDVKQNTFNFNLENVLMAKQSQFPQPLLIRLLLQTLHQLRCPSLDTLQHLSVFLVVRGPKLNTVFENSQNHTTENNEKQG